MTFRLLAFLAFLPFLAFGVTNGDVWDCNLYCNEGGHCSFICSSGEPSGDDPPDALTQGQCLKMKEDMKSAFSSADSAIGITQGVVAELLNTVDRQMNEVTEIYNNCGQILDEDSGITQDTYNLLQDNRAICSQMMTEIGSSQSRLRSMRENLAHAAADIEGGRATLDNVSCSSKQCTQTGVAGGCGECHDDLVNILAVLNAVNASVKNTEQEAIEQLPHLALIASSASNMAEWVEIVGDRLRAPDDRLWDDLQDLYMELGSRSNNYVHSSLYLPGILHDFRNMMDGYRMMISSEGVLQLYQLLFDMYASYQRANMLGNVEVILDGYTNSILSLFKQYKLQTIFNPGVYPSGAKLDIVTDVFTNSAAFSSAIGPRTRFHKLFQTTQGGVTNWFMRMELYQQAALGWFDNLASSVFEDRQAGLDGDILSHDLEYTTNRLHLVNESVSNTFLVTESALGSVVRGFGSVEIVAELPSEILLFPETEIGNFGSFGPIAFHPGDIKQYCDVARKFTTLVWRLMIWTLYIFVAVGIGRLLFIVVLFIIRFVRDL